MAINLKNRTKPIRVAFNMLCCAVFFCWARPEPRETISGLFGRKCRSPGTGVRKRFWNFGLELIDSMHDEPDHCRETAFLEYEARRILGYDDA